MTTIHNLFNSFFGGSSSNRSNKQKYPSQFQRDSEAASTAFSVAENSVPDDSPQLNYSQYHATHGTKPFKLALKNSNSVPYTNFPEKVPARRNTEI